MSELSKSLANSASEASNSVALAVIICALGVAAAIHALTVLHPGVGICFLFFLALTVINYRVGRQDLLYPAFIFSSVWTFATLVYAFCPVNIDTMRLDSAIVFTVGGLCFSLGCATGNRAFVRNRAAWFSVGSVNPQPRRFLLLYVALVFPLFVRDIVRLAGGFSLSSDFFIKAREGIIASFALGVKPYSSIVTSTAPTIAVVTCWMFLLEENSRTLKALAIALAIVMSILTTGRTLLLELLCGWLMISFWRREDRSFVALRKPAILAITAILVITSAVALFTKKETQGDNSLEVAGKMSAVYLAGPLAAFNYAMHHRNEWDAHNNSHFDRFVFVPFPINVYTIYKPSYFFQGPLASFAWLTFLGVVNGLVFNAAMRGNQVAILVFAYFCFALGFTIFSDPFGESLAHILEITLYASFYIGVLRRFPKLKLMRTAKCSNIVFIEQE